MLTLMKNQVLPHIEDYLEVLGGYVLNNLRIQAPIIRLARYDTQIVDSMASQTSKGIALTDKQADLAHKLVIKYRKQLSQHGIDIGDQENNRVFRMPLRVVDRKREVFIDDGLIKIKFPYESQVIDYIRGDGSKIPGSISFDKEKKLWTAYPTEPRIQWLPTLVDKFQFELDQKIESLIDEIKSSSIKKFKIELVETDKGYEILNSEETLNSYIQSNLKGFDKSNLINLVDHSSILGFSISPDIHKKIIEEYHPIFARLLIEREPHVPLSDDQALSVIVEYARTVGRLPIYVFENVGDSDEQTNLRKCLAEIFGDDGILDVNSRKQKIDDDRYQCIYATSWNTKWESRIPLMLTTTAMMLGPKKKHIMQNSEKVVYCTEVVYNVKL